MHVELARALAPVMQDLTSTGAPVPRVVDDRWAESPTTASAMLWSSDGSGTGIYVHLGVPRAEQQKDPVLPTPRKLGAVPWTGPTMTNWPPCPQHPTTHPLEAEARDGAARVLPEGRHGGRRRRDVALTYSGRRYFAASRTCAIAARA